MYNLALVEIVLPLLLAMPVLTLLVLFRLLSFNQASRLNNRSTHRRITDCMGGWFTAIFASLLAISFAYYLQTSGRPVHADTFGGLTVGALVLVTVWVFYHTREYD